MEQQSTYDTLPLKFWAQKRSQRRCAYGDKRKGQKVNNGGTKRPNRPPKGAKGS